MKRVTAIFLLGWFIAPVIINAAETTAKLTGQDIVNRMDEVINPDTMEAKMQMTIVTSSGEERTFIYQSYSKDKGEKNLVRYLEPSRTKGQAILMLNNAEDIWAYFPRTRRIRKLATHAKRQKFEGSDFSYEDMGSGDTFIKDYTSRRLDDEKKEGFDCYKVELKKKKTAKTSYPRMILWIIKKNFFPVAINYYSEDDPQFLKKVLIQRNIEIVDGIPTAVNMVMQNKADYTSTKMKILDVKYNEDIPDSFFSERNLRQ